jgi:hypothetical protein
MTSNRAGLAHNQDLTDGCGTAAQISESESPTEE